jgi:hypothetical protein
VLVSLAMYYTVDTSALTLGSRVQLRLRPPEESRKDATDRS